MTENYNNRFFEEEIDPDIREEIASMSESEIQQELARLQKEEEKEELNRSSVEESKEIADKASELTATPGAVMSRVETKTLDSLLVAGATPEKAKKWLLGQRKTGLNTADLEPREVVQSQYLQPDSVYQESAAQQLKGEFINEAIKTDSGLPIELIKEMSHARTKGESALLLRKYEQDLVDTAKDTANAFLLEQSQDQFLPRLLRSRIAGLSVSNLAEAQREVSELIKNYRR